MFHQKVNITGIVGLLEYSICWFHVYIYICVLNLWNNVVLYACHVDHSMHDERSSSNFANFNGINRNIQLRFCIEHQTKVTYIYRNTRFDWCCFCGRCWRYGFGRIPKYNVICIYICRFFLFKRSSKINR